MAKSQTKLAPKLTMAEKLTSSSLFWASVILFVAFPFINNFFIQTVMLNISGNIAYKDLAPVLSTVAGLLSVLVAYAGIGTVAAAIANFGAKRSVGTVILALFSHVAGLIAYIMSYAISGARNYGYAIFSLSVDALANMLIYAAIIIMIAAMKKKNVKKGNCDSPELSDKLISKGGAYSYIVAATTVYGAAQILSTLFTMVSDFLDPSIGVPINLQEWVYWITKYLTTFIYLGIGYLIVLGIFYLAKHLKKQFEETERTEKA